jgi:hypothetical protein
MSAPTWSEAQLRAALDEYELELRRAGKARNTITTYVQHPERFINWLVGTYKPSPRSSGRSQASRYQPLHDHLVSQGDPLVRLTFPQIERIIDASLPDSARKYRPWWANESAGTHVHARAWLDAGWKTRNVDLASGTVEFVRS